MMRPRLWLAVAAVMLFCGWAFPMYWMAVASLSPESQLFDEPSWVPRTLILDHYRALFTERQFWVPVRNSLVVAGATTALAIVVGTPAAYALARLRFPGRRTLLAAILAVSVFPQIAVVSPLYLLLRTLGLIDTFPGLVLPYLTFSVPLAVWLMTGFFRQLPRELEEAALIDGASYWTIFWRVSVPQLGPALATLGIITFIGSWNNFVSPFVLVRSFDAMTLPVGVVALQGVMGSARLSVIMAATTMSILPLVIVFVVAQRFIIESMTMSGVKG